MDSISELELQRLRKERLLEKEKEKEERLLRATIKPA